MTDESFFQSQLLRLDRTSGAIHGYEMKQNDQQEDNTSEKIGKHAELHVRDHFLWTKSERRAR